MATGLSLTLILGVSACGSDDDPSGSTTTIEAQIGDAATAESTSTAPDTAPVETTPTTGAPVGTPDPETAAATFYMAWKANDPVIASTVAEPAAVESFSTIAPGDYSLYNRCNTGEFGQSTCLYRGDPGTIQFAMVDREGSWVVTAAVFSAA